MNWSILDFVIMGILLLGASVSYALVKSTMSRKYRLLIGISAVLLTLWIWAELAVGIFTNLGS